MSTLGLMLTLFMTLVFTSCQVKDSAGGGLFSGHVPTTNKFTVQTPASKIYLDTETVTINVSFPFDITLDTTGGNPRLRLTVGSTTRYATYVPGTDPTLLSFSYTFVAGDNDTNGIDVNALELNGSTMTFDKDGVATNCDVSTVTTTNFANVKVDTVAATISSLQFVNTVGQYNAGKTLSMRVTFSEAVVVTGVPYFQVTFGAGGTHDLEYQSGSGSNVLIFSYTIDQSDYDINGYTFSNTLVLNGGTIKDTAGINTALSLAGVVAAANSASANIDIVGTYPTVVSVTTPADGTYAANEELDFVLEYDRIVNVTGTPYITLTLATPPTIPSSTRQAQYVSGAGSEFLTFRYVPVPGDGDLDGIAVATTITDNGGTITSASGTSYFQTGNNIFTVPSTTGVRVNAILPQVITVTRNADTSAATWGTAVDNYWIIGQVLDITLNFNTNILVNQVGGTPFVPITIGSTVRNATYLSGGDGNHSSLVFRYTIQEGEEDLDGTIAIGSINLNNGYITDSQNTNASLTLPVTGITTTYVDAVRPILNSTTPITKPTITAGSAFSNVAPYQEAQFVFRANWSEAVRYTTTATGNTQTTGSIALTLPGGGAFNMTSNGSSDTTPILHQNTATTFPTNLEGGITIGSTITTPFVKDRAGNTALATTFTAPDVSDIIVDTKASTVSTITQTTPTGTFIAGDTIDFNVTFNEAVTITSSGGYPRIPITLNSGGPGYMVGASGSGTSHTFTYTVASPQMDDNGIATANTVANGAGTVVDQGRNQTTVGVAQSFPSTFIDTEAPTVTAATKPANGTYEGGDTLTMTVTFSEAVTVTGTPRIPVMVGSTTQNLLYTTGSGTTTLTFSYSLATTDFDPDGLPDSVDTITTSGATIVDAAGNDASTDLDTHAQDLSSIFVMVPNTDIWVQKEFVNRAKAGSPTITNSGSASYAPCGSGQCRELTGDDNMSLSTSVTNVKVAFVVVVLPNAAGSNYNLLRSRITLNGTTDITEFNLRTGSYTASVNLDNVNRTTNQTSHTLGMTPGDGAVHVLQVTYQSTISTGTGTFISNSPTTGMIGEIITLGGAPTPAQINSVRNYLLNKY